MLSPRIWFIGAPMLVALFFYIPSPMLILVGILAIPSLIAAWRYDPKSPEALRYRSIEPATRFEYAVLYLGLAEVLAIMAYHAHENLALA